jgi:hypothetical protein
MQAQSPQAPKVLPDDNPLYALIASALQAVHEFLATGIIPTEELVEQVRTGLNLYVQTLPSESLAHHIVTTMRQLFIQMTSIKVAAIQRSTPAERKSFLDPAIQNFIRALLVIPSMGEFLATM